VVEKDTQRILLRPMPHRPVLPYIPSLDGLRGLAVAAVLLFHGGFLPGGYLGVDLFFALSGFLITSLLLAEGRASGKIELLRFWEQRARRLLPALAALLFAVALYCAALAAPEELAEIRSEALASLLYISNWYAVFVERDYWALFRTPSPLQHTWSIGIEEQFYLVWPLAIAGVLARFRERTPDVVLVGAVLLGAASAACMGILYDPHNTGRVYYGTDTRIAPILFGAALAAWHTRYGGSRTRSARWLAEIAGAAGLAGLAWASWRLEADSPSLYQGGFFWCGVAEIAVIAAAVVPSGLLARALGSLPLRGLGIVSYGVYLWHWPVYLVLDPARTGLADAPLLGLRLAATLVIATLSYWLLERPIRRGAFDARHWTVVVPGVSGALVAVIFASTSGVGARAALPGGYSHALPHAVPGSASRSDSGSIGVLILGDSVGITLHQGLEHAAADHDLDVRLGVEIGCERDSQEPGCPAPWVEQVASVRPDVVLIAESGLWSLLPLEVGSRVLAIGTEDWNEAWIWNTQATVDELLGAGARRVVFTTLACFEPSWFQRQPRLAPQNTAQVNENLSIVAARNPGRVELIDLAAYVCPGGQAVQKIESVETLRFDGVHYSPEGSDLVGRWLAPQLAAAATRERSARRGGAVVIPPLVR
jgi:peptidoglycan/LPS O-acetylase OafA/YrhL